MNTKSKLISLRGAGAAALLVGLSLAAGCGYPSVNEAAYSLARTTYNVCSLENESQLPQLRELITTAAEQGEISESESAMLLELVERAEAGDWESAREETRHLLEDQVVRAKNTPGVPAKQHSHSHDHEQTQAAMPGSR